ncbi:MAG: hypothetical protein CM15mP40_02140 [Alphaproteobacteria bacterium]|nr:MAG: hypothetical protein CM15mP40_02140 [Alphaproteobacteria bacterium]
MGFDGTEKGGFCSPGQNKKFWFMKLMKNKIVRQR